MMRTRVRKAGTKQKSTIKWRYRHPILHTIGITSVLSVLIVITGGLLYIQSVIADVPTITEHQLKSDGTSNMYDSEGNLIWSDTEVRRDYVTIEDVPQTYIDALLSTENATFYEDRGFSVKGVANAFLSKAMSLVGKGQARGGSSIEQQLVKNTTGDNEVSVSRKIREFWLAIQLSQNFSKDRILEYYINKINMGENSYGADTIAMTYFGKHLKEMDTDSAEDLSHLATIAGLGQAPSTYNLYDNPDATRQRRDVVLAAMLKNEKITKTQYEEAKAVDIQAGLKERYWRNTEVQGQIAHYNAYVTSALEEIKELGYDIEKTPLQITTHLNPEQYNWLLNEVAQDHYYQDEGQEVAVTVVDVETGAVIAQAGGRRQGEAYGLNRATQRTRSSGSTIKPFIDYAPMIEYFGMGTNAVWSSAPYTYPGTNITANNYGGYTYGDVTAQYALRMSLNTPVIRMLDTMGSAYAKRMLQNFGLDVKETYGGSDAIGLDVSTQDFALAFATIARGGEYQKASYVKSITFSDGSTKEISQPKERTIKESTAYTLIHMLKGVTDQGMSGEQAAMPEFQGLISKTGLVGYDTNDGVWRPDFSSSDSWIGGATKSIAVAVWTGYDSPNEPGHWLLASTTTRYELYQAIMRHYNQGRDTSMWEKPSTVTSLEGDYVKPNDTNRVLYAPLTGEHVSTELEKLSDSPPSSIDMKPTKEKADVPEDWTYNKWIELLPESDKAIYEKWIQGNDSLPTYSSDVYTGKEDDDV